VNAPRNNGRRGFFFGLFPDRCLRQRLLSVVLLAFLCQLTIPYLTTECPLYASGAHAAKSNCPLAASSAKQTAVVDPAKPAHQQSHDAGSCALCLLTGPASLYIATGFQSLPLPPIQANTWLAGPGETPPSQQATSPFSARAPPV
jgi:hypothetical protein